MALSTFACGRLWGARYGTGRPWAFALHGWGRDHSDFDPVLEGLDAVALDLPGHGVAPEPPRPWSTREYAEWVLPVLDDLGPGPVAVCGHSFGGRVALQLAAVAGATVRPASVGVLVLSGAPLAPAPGRRPARQAVGYRVGRALHKAGLVSPAKMERLRRRYGSEDYRRASPVMRGVLVKAVGETADGTYVTLLRSLSSEGKPVELVWGEHDDQAPLGPLGVLVEALPSVSLTVVPGAGHLMTPALAAEIRAAVLRHQPGA